MTSRRPVCGLCLSVDLKRLGQHALTGKELTLPAEKNKRKEKKKPQRKKMLKLLKVRFRCGGTSGPSNSHMLELEGRKVKRLCMWQVASYTPPPPPPRRPYPTTHKTVSVRASFAEQNGCLLSCQLRFPDLCPVPDLSSGQTTSKECPQSKDFHVSAF